MWSVSTCMHLDRKKWRKLIGLRGKKSHCDDKSADSKWCVFSTDLVPSHPGWLVKWVCCCTLDVGMKAKNYVEFLNSKQRLTITYLSTDFSLHYPRAHYLVNNLCIFLCSCVLHQQQISRHFIRVQRQYVTYGARHSKSRSMHHCKVLPHEEYNCMIPGVQLCRKTNIGLNSGILLLLVCVSLTILGQPRNSVLIRRVQPR